jgi:hypothetical protein
MLVNNFITLMLTAFAVSSISFTVTFTGLFKEVREVISAQHHKLEELIHCPWCFSHWVTFFIVLLSSSTISFTGIGLFDFFITSFAITGVSGLFHYVLLRAYEPVAKAMVHRQIEKMRNND